MMQIKKNRCFFAAAFIVVLVFAALGCSTSKDQNISASGTVEATETNVNAESGGKITEVLVYEGKAVKQGDVLARIDGTVQALQVQQAEAVYRAAQEKARETKTGTRQQLIDQASAAVRQMISLQQGARDSMNNAKENLDRIQALLKEGGATPQQLSDARTRYETAKAQYDAYAAQRKSAEDQLDLLKTGSTQETINIADAGVAQAQAGLSIARVQLAKTVLYAPTNGVVSSLNFNKGEFVSPGAAVVSVTDTADMWINVYIPEKDLPQIKLKQKAEIYVDAYPNKPFHGQVSYISDKAEFTPKNLQTKEERVNMVFAVKIKITDGKEQLKPGLPADIKIFTR